LKVIAPKHGRVEIAYFTFPEFEGYGFASAMAARLVTIAREHHPSVVVAAQTLPERNASHRVLEKLGFRHVDTFEQPEDGMVWKWQLNEATGDWHLTTAKFPTSRLPGNWDVVGIHSPALYLEKSEIVLV
jgi:RimJ/RimL family protein N-acetyltransferase